MGGLKTEDAGKAMVPTDGQRGACVMSGRGMGGILIRAPDDIWLANSDPKIAFWLS